MYVHIGEDMMLRSKDVVAILDKETVTGSPEMETYLQKHEKSLVRLTDSGFKTIIITDSAVYFSPVSSATLKKRMSEIGHMVTF